VFVGFDQPRPMGRGMTGGHVAAPIFTEFMKVALADAPPKEFQAPPGIELIPVDRRTGLRAQAGAPGVILEAFKPGTEPPTAYSVVGYQASMGTPVELQSNNSEWSGAFGSDSGFSRGPRQRESTMGTEGQYRMLPNGVIIKVR
jgi:membrane carboxypeptidase/penicillin-binding protein